MNETITKLRSLLEEVTIQYDAEWIGFSGGLDSSILAQIKKESGQNLKKIESDRLLLLMKLGNVKF